MISSLAVQSIVLGVTSDLVSIEGTKAFPDYPLEALSGHARLKLKHLDVADGFDPSDLADLDLLISVPHGAPLDALAIGRADRLAAVMRVGAGFEDCDVEALTQAGIALVTANAATQRPTAMAALTLILALATRLLDKHRLSLEGPAGWSRRAQLRGSNLKGKVLGLVGCGTIARDLITISRPLGLTYLVNDPALSKVDAESIGVRLVSLDELLAKADFVSIHCPLTPQTRHLIDAARLGLMKCSAYLVNTARGGVVDQKALTKALMDHRIAGAGLDVFEFEPPSEDDPLLRLDNVVLSGHALNWTKELDADLGRSNCAAVFALLNGEVPEGIVNRAVLHDMRFLEKLKGFACGGLGAPRSRAIGRE